MPLLADVKASLPAAWYYDPAHYRRELEAIWYRDWVCVGRLEDIPAPGDYVLAGIGDQKIIVTRNAAGDLRAFHNTCRHRGSALCRDTSGRFRNQRIVCPYHTWTWSTDGELLSTPGRIDSAGFDAADYSLYPVAVDAWRSFVFVNLSPAPACTLAGFLGDEARNVDNWPLETLRRAHRETTQLACNWKIFWENYSECYHCPRIHPELCRIMPGFRHALTSEADLPGWQPAFEGDTGRPRVADGARTWTLDGQSDLPSMDGPDDAELRAGVVFASFTASMFIVAHPDYVRTVRIVPTGPESIDLLVDWLLPESAPVSHESALSRILGLARTVIRQDGEVCEINQRGLKSLPHEAGVLVAQERDVWEFHEWLRGRLAHPDS